MLRISLDIAHDQEYRRADRGADHGLTILAVGAKNRCPYAGVIIPRLMDYALQVEPPAYDLAKAKQLLAAAGYPNGLDAGDFVPIPACTDVSEAVVNDLSAVGIRVKMRAMGRAAFLSAWHESAS